MKYKVSIIIFIVMLGGLTSALKAQDPNQKWKELSALTPSSPSPAANYVNAVRTGNLLFLAGKGPALEDGSYITGKLGKDLTIDLGYEAARRTGLAQIAVLKNELGDLNRVKRIVKVLGMVNADPTFTDHSKVMNGYSDLMVEVFGEKGRHARSSVGMTSLPFNIAVEVEMIVEIVD